MKTSTWLRTVRHLSPGQIAWRGVHVARAAFYQRIDTTAGTRWLGAPPANVRAFSARPIAWPFTQADRARADLWRQGEVDIHGFRAARGDWHNRGQSRLWRYERHYHAELVALAAAFRFDGDPLWLDDARALVSAWQTACPPLAGDAWEPYPVARRVLNWSLALALAPSLDRALATALATQTQFLSRHLERHLGGNHLLCDLFALVAATCVIDFSGSAELCTRARDELSSELFAQVLPDGGYAERTVQYHSIVLRDLLGVLVLARRRGRVLGLDLCAWRMLAWLAAVTDRGRVTHWQNDAAPDATPSFHDLVTLAHAAGLDAQTQSPPIDEIASATGWTILREGASELLIDHGPLGPDEQPGHGHADTLAYELTLQQTALVVDTGTTTYAVGPTRAYERSPAAHATVTVNGVGLDEPWASFRVGGRARDVHSARTEMDDATTLIRLGARSFQGWRHERAIVFRPDCFCLVVDRVHGVAAHARVSSWVPLAPERKLHQLSPHAWSVGSHDSSADSSRGSNTPVFELHVPWGKTTVVDGWVGEGFERRKPRPVITIVGSVDQPLAHAWLTPGARFIVEPGRLAVQTESGELFSITLQDLFSCASST